MQEVTLIFPHQLFKDNPAVHGSMVVYLVEEFLYFRQYRFHKQKLVLHRASMKSYADHLTRQHIPVVYIEATSTETDVRLLIQQLAGKGITRLHYTDTTDNWLNKRIEQQAASLKIPTTRYSNPNFLNKPESVQDFFDEQQRYFQTDFYIDQRKKRNLLLEGNGRALGGKWSYDADNRQRFPNNQTAPRVAMPAANQYVAEAKAYVERHFSDHYGSIGGPFKDGTAFYPVDHAAAEAWLNDFLENRFSKFGIYEDAMVTKESVLHHSVLTPVLNIGLLHPQQVIDKALDAAIQFDVPLNSLEGFIRQVMGWREFIRIVYGREGSRQRTTNFWGFTRKIPSTFWKAETGIVPVDAVVKKVLQTGYCHHIERLMVLGNFMLLCEFDPDEVYKWFMEMYIDSYDWVMVPNIYGMTQFADGGLMTTKPYISGSNYLMKMGDFEKGPWQQVWDGLFWRFMHVHRDFFLQNPRLAMLVSSFDKMDKQKQQAHMVNAESFLQQLDELNNLL